jgi:hypothetical protein
MNRRGIRTAVVHELCHLRYPKWKEDQIKAKVKKLGKRGLPITRLTWEHIRRTHSLEEFKER